MKQVAAAERSSIVARNIALVGWRDSSAAIRTSSPAA
jgi:hypothetical protein